MKETDFYNKMTKSNVRVDNRQVSKRDPTMKNAKESPYSARRRKKTKAPNTGPKGVKVTPKPRFGAGSPKWRGRRPGEDEFDAIRRQFVGMLGSSKLRSAGDGPEREKDIKEKFDVFVDSLRALKELHVGMGKVESSQLP